MQAIGGHNLATLKEMSDLYLYDFGIFLELQPDEEEKAVLENNIQMALQQQSIDLEDAIDVREIRNVKLANQVLKIRRKKKTRKRPVSSTTKYTSSSGGKRANTTSCSSS